MDAARQGERRTSTAGDPDDLYAILGASRKAAPQEIKRLYREAVKRCHPDLGTEPERIEVFKRVTHAYAVLSNPVLRAAYDREGEAAPADAVAEDAFFPADAPAADERRAQERARQTDEVLAAGQASLDSQQFEAAAAAGRLVLRWDRNNADAYVLVAEALCGLGRMAEARGCLLLALQIKPAHAEARRVLWRMQNRQTPSAAGQEEKARQRP